jgi:hypothetical protein
MGNEKQLEKINNCPNCGSDDVILSPHGVSVSIKCLNCFKIKVLCCDTRKEAITIWNRITMKQNEK